MTTALHILLHLVLLYIRFTNYRIVIYEKGRHIYQKFEKRYVGLDFRIVTMMWLFRTPSASWSGSLLTPTSLTNPGVGIYISIFPWLLRTFLGPRQIQASLQHTFNCKLYFFGLDINISLLNRSQSGYIYIYIHCCLTCRNNPEVEIDLSYRSATEGMVVADSAKRLVGYVSINIFIVVF